MSSVGKGGRYLGLTNMSPSCADFLQIMGATTSWRTNGLSRSIYGFPFFTSRVSNYRTYSRKV